MAARDSNATQETRLLDYIAQCEQHTRDRRAVYVHLSSIKPAYRSEADVKDTVNKAENLAHRYRGEAFRLRNDDIVIVMKGAEDDLVEDILHRIRTTFRHDPLLRTAPESFITHYDLEEAYQDLLSFVKVIKHRLELQGGHVSDRPVEVDYDDPGAVRTIISVASPHDFVIRRPIYTVTSARRLEPYVYDMEIQPQAFDDVMLDGVVQESNPDFVTQAYALLERRLLCAIPHMRVPWPLPWGLSVSAETLLSAEFMLFHKNWRTSWGDAQELQPVFFVAAAALRDLDRWQFAQSFLGEWGYSVCLDIDMSPRVTEVDLDQLGCRYLRIKAPSAKIAAEEKALYRALVQRWGVDRLIFAHCDQLDHLMEACAIGAYLVQGKAADAIYSGEETWAA